MATAACRAGCLSCCFPRCPQCQEKPIIRNAISYIYLSLSPPASSSRLPSRPCAAPPPSPSGHMSLLLMTVTTCPNQVSTTPFQGPDSMQHHSSGPCWGTLTRGSGMHLAGAGLSVPRLHLLDQEDPPFPFSLSSAKRGPPQRHSAPSLTQWHARPPDTIPRKVPSH